MLESEEESELEDDENRTIYVSGLKESTTEDAVTLFFENRRRSGGGDLCEGKERYKRISPTVACLTFVSSKGDVFLCDVLLSYPLHVNSLRILSSSYTSSYSLSSAGHILLFICIPLFLFPLSTDVT